ncbi:molybdopterin-dependent oxidoreductase [Pseudooceanicola sp. CBS1P-1]|uniref:Molybdopterin-dependent oxidoreductase n=1 Tax=Pseudooceanicola albus TaxID=2692189 RepID=A0A6L7FZK2_9RHOB|nr:MULTISPECIES: molybdopterin-dependent oxidoreductase [Pseudooceanicola]MBT9383680.1 molybdopterin-dependent oxidoreductase [Pseudooceanicola endophyticus]MXN17534.1 molybdopterin-dependent oxidoreductase [Pseudooceanicola albus]
MFRTALLLAALLPASLLCGLSGIPPAAHAATEAPPQDAVLLTVTTPAGVTRLDRAALNALEATEFTTSTIWTEGPQTFRGVRMTTLLAHLGITRGAVHLTAANDYTITIPVQTFRPDGAILAYSRNGAPMSLRSKGPLWMVYPYDSSPDFQTEVIYSNSIWQLERLSVTE